VDTFAAQEVAVAVVVVPWQLWKQEYYWFHGRSKPTLAKQGEFNKNEKHQQQN